MKAVPWLVAGSLGSALMAVGMVGRPLGAEVTWGMAGPLAAVVISWVATERTYRRRPASVTAVMMTAFAVKAVFFGAYVAVMLKVVGLRPVPFVASFTGYFIALYLVEALLMRRLFET